MKQLSDYILVSDMDGTLFGVDGVIPPRNIEAITRFVEKGGRFGVATGRSRGLMRPFGKILPINAPCILYNGGAVYDFANDRLMMERFLPAEAEEYVREIMEEFTGIGVMVIGGDNYYQVKEEQAFSEFVETRGAQFFHRCKLDEANGPWYKALFQVFTRDYELFLERMREKHYTGVRFVGTSPNLIEMLPVDSSKGKALRQLLDQRVFQRENLAVIGDYYNDVEMIELAGLGVTLRTSPEEIRRGADLVVGDCAGGAVADLIEHLERLCNQPD